MSTFDALDIDQAGLLSDATVSALQLRQQPFTITPADGEWFTDSVNTEQLEDIKEALVTGDDLLLVIGPSGAGKTTLLNQLGANSGLRIQCFSVKGSPRFSTNNLFAGMLEAFKRKPPDDLKLALDELIPCLQGMNNRNTLSAIVLDDADRVPESELTKLLSGMLYVNSRDETLMRIALAAGAEIDERIPELLPEGADMPYSTLSIEIFDDDRATALLDHRLMRAGFTGDFPFTEAEMAQINERAGGLPTAIQSIAADQLNERYGPLEHVVPPELLSQPKRGVLHSKTGKFILGALAALMIVGGLLLFLRPDLSSSTQASAPSLEERSVDNSREAERLRLLEEEESARAIASAQRQAKADAEAAEAEAAEAEAAAAAAKQAAEASAESASATNGVNNEAGSSLAGEAGNQADDNDNSSAARSANPTSHENTVTASAATTTTPADTATASEDAAADDNAAAATDNSDATQASGAATESAEAGAETAAEASESSADDDSAADADSTTDNPAGTDTPSTNNEGTNNEEASASTEEQASDDAASTAADAATDATSTAEADADPVVQVLESPNWILVQNPDQYTVQMSASTERKSVEEFLDRNELDPPNSIFSFTRKGVTWYALVHGLYPSIDDARAAIERMPATARTNQPWIRAIKRIQAALKDQN